jgi:hypothetical protein
MCLSILDRFTSYDANRQFLCKAGQKRVTKMEEIMQLEVSSQLREKLRLVRESQLSWFREKMEQHPSQLLSFCYEELNSVDGIHLYGTIGAESYLTFDGHILLSMDSGRPENSHPPRATSNIGWIALGISTLSLCFNLPEVLELLPARPIDAAPCPHCNGLRFAVDCSPGSSSFGSQQACRRCYGLGWSEPILRDE